MATLTRTGSRCRWVVLRHSAATRLLRAEVPLPAISAVLGHSAEDSASVHMNADRDRLLQCVLPVPAGARR